MFSSKHVTDDSLEACWPQALDDPHPDVRAAARRALHSGRQGRAAQGGDRPGRPRRWPRSGGRAQEQAIVLLADLDHKPAAARLAELLTATAPEVFVTAAWALRRLGEPSSLPAVLAYLEAEQPRYAGQTTRPRPAAGLSPSMVDHQMSQLMQLLVLQRHRPALPLMRRMVPPNEKVGRHEDRAAGIWGLGKLHDLESAAEYAGALVERLNDGVRPAGGSPGPDHVAP